MVRLLILLTSFFFCFNATAALSADCGLFRVVKGKVTFKKKGKKKFKKASINKKICQGDTVKTKSNSRAKIVMADKNELNVSPETELQIEIYKNTANEKQVLLNVVYGKVRSNVKEKYKNNKKSHYRVKTKSAVAGVRGTEFLASYSQKTNQSRIVTFEGEVAVGKMQGGEFLTNVVVKPGFFTASGDKGAAPHSPKELPPKEFAQMDRESSVADPGTSSSPAAAPRKPSNEKNKEEPKKEQPAPAENPKKPAAENVKKPAGEKAGEHRPKPGHAGAHQPGPDASGRDIASVEPNFDVPMDDFLPSPDDIELLPPPPGPPAFQQIRTIGDINNVGGGNTVCTTCQDAITNKKVRVTIIPTIGGVPIQ